MRRFAKHLNCHAHNISARAAAKLHSLSRLLFSTNLSSARRQKSLSHDPPPDAIGF
jgi:hypothetical protein